MKNKGGSKMSKDQLIERLQKIRHELDVISENGFSGFTLKYCMGSILTELDTIITKLSDDKLNVKSEDEIEMTDEADVAKYSALLQESYKRMMKNEAKDNSIEQKIAELNDKLVEVLQKMEDKELIEREISDLDDKVVETLQKMKNERLIRQLRGIGNHLNNISATAIKGDPQTKFLDILGQSNEARREITNIILEIENE